MEDLNQRLITASYANNLKEVKSLLNEGAFVNTIDGLGNTPLMIALEKGYHDLAKYLLDAGSNPNNTNSLGENSLYIAIPDTISLYILNNHDVNVNKSTIKGTPLQKAVDRYVYYGEGNKELILSLLKKGALITNDVASIDIDRIRDSAPFFRDYIMNIEKRKNEVLNIFEIYLDNFRESDGVTRLMNAASDGNLKFIKSISPLSYEENDDYGNTPLIYAVMSGNNNVVEHLLKNGVDPNITNNEGLTALSFALINEEIGSALLLLGFNAEYKDYVKDFPEIFDRIFKLNTIDISDCHNTQDYITLENINQFNVIKILWDGSNNPVCYDKLSLLDYTENQNETYGIDTNDNYINVYSLPPKFYILMESKDLLKKHNKFRGIKFLNSVGFGPKEGREFSPVYKLEAAE